MTLEDRRLPPLAVLGKADYPSGCLRGYCHTTYSVLLHLLGQPHATGGDKTNVEWAFRCNDGSSFHVYDWEEPAIPTERYAWHIGGSSDRALAAFHRFTGLSVAPMYDDNSTLADTSNADQSNSPETQELSA